MKVAYFVHDLNDAAVARRVAMMQAGGAFPIVLGFRRSETVPATIAGAPAIDLGRTADARLVQRAWAVVKNLLRPWRLRAIGRAADVVIGRNLEALALAATAAGGTRPLVYECLDIHRSLVGTGRAARLVQRVEAWLLARIDLLLVSSPAFHSEYFRARRHLDTPTMLLENKLPAWDAAEGDTPPPPVPAPAGPPWRIGWFGMLRCRKTLAMLKEIVRRSEGDIEVLIAGKPAYTEFVDFDAEVRDTPGLTYHGPYKPEDLDDLYGRTHFAWAIDYFEEGLNSRWLLPNRIYEATGHGSVPIALAGVQTAAWLSAREIGLIVQNPIEDVLRIIKPMEPARYMRLHQALARVPIGDLTISRAECVELVQALGDAGDR
ncbi:hypothetical protein PQ455_09490 [Sphingomonas naphthae]|uniref:Glycosyl transferase family 1 n=1 Tax=Sphingomonas naphthae TaxID=1813468 RepID=A0ABY7TFY9_9SPHN|nr:hypothetical protein [Sphingomonas naphthae]WCT71886.1 hypothetical protein PQ455_09490 [Sphingomonas naphthae]